MAIDALWLQNNAYPARLDRLTFDAIWTEGILGTGSLAVTQSGPPAMTVQVATGIAIIQGDDQANQGKYLIRNDAAVTGVAIGAAPGSGQRNDLVVMRVRDPNASGPAGNDAVVQVVVGTPALSPVDPAVPASALVLARVRVPAGTIQITNALIDDLRVAASDAYTTTPAGSITVGMLSSAVASALVPTGTVLPYGGSAAPTGYLLCDGTAYATATYPALSAVIGSSFNTSAGQSAPPAGQFRVPILTTRIPVGRLTADSDFGTVGQTGGDRAVTLTDLQSGVATHTHPASVVGTSGGQSADHGHFFTTASDGSHSHSIDLIGTTDQDHFHLSAASSDYAAGKPNAALTGAGSKSGIVNSAGSHTHTGGTGGVTAGHTHTTTSTGTATAPTTAPAAQAHTNLQPYIVVNYIIKT